MTDGSGQVTSQDITPTSSSPVRQWLEYAPILAWRLGLGPVLGQVVLVLSTTGRVSHATERMGLPYYTWRTRKYVVTRSDETPDWMANLAADSCVTIQSGRGTEHMVARKVTEDIELIDVYAMAQQSPDLHRWFEKTLNQSLTQDAFMANKDRFTLVTFDPTGNATPEPLAVDLWWVWVLVGGVFALWHLIQGRSEE